MQVTGQSTDGTAGGGPRPGRSTPQGRAADRLTDVKYRWPGRYRASWAALVVLVVAVAAIVPQALGGSSLALVTALAGILAIAGFGQMLIIMLGAIDLSCAAIMSVACGMAVHYGVEGANVPLVVLASLVVSILLSLVNGLLIRVFQLNAMIVTLATFGVISGLIALWTGVSLSLTGLAPRSLQDVAHASFLNLNACFLFALVVAVVLAAILGKTRFGRQVAAGGANRKAAAMLGIRVTRVQLMVFGLAGLLYGIAGVLLAGFIGTPDVVAGTPYQLATITVAGIAGVAFSGGPASVASVLTAALFLQLLSQALSIFGFSGGGSQVIQGLALVCAVAALSLGQYGRSGLSHGLGLIGRHRRAEPLTASK